MMPDLFYRDPIPLNRPGDFDIMKWMKGEYSESKIAHTPPVVDPIIDSCLVEMRTKYNCKVSWLVIKSQSEHTPYHNSTGIHLSLFCFLFFFGPR